MTPTPTKARETGIRRQAQATGRRRRQSGDLHGPDRDRSQRRRLEAGGLDGGYRTGRLYRDYPLQLAGSELEVKKELRATFNGEPETNWDYRASIMPLQPYGDAELTSSQEAEYWTVKPGLRETTVDVTDLGASNGTISIESDVVTVTEGNPVVFTLYRVDGPMNKPVTVRVQTTEPNRQVGFGVNPSTEYHNVTIQPWQGDAEFTVHSSVDGVTEAGADQLIADILSISQVDGAERYTEGLPNQVSVEINDPPSGQHAGYGGRQSDFGGRGREAPPSRSPGPAETQPNPLP